MATPPLRTAISDTYPNPSNATARTGFGALWDYVTGLLGATGNQAEARAALGIGGVGQCRLVKSGANIVLQPYDGALLTVNNVNCSIPSAGVSLAPTGLTPSTVYNIYAVATGGVITSMEASTTAHALDATNNNGMRVKSGDTTRTLIGKVRPITGPAFADTDAQRFVISWFNRLPIRIYNKNASAPATTSTTPVALVSNMEFLSWGDSCVPASFVGSVANNTTNSVCYTALGLDSVTTFTHAPVQYQAYAVSALGAACGGSTFVPTEGYHYIYTLGQVNSGTGTWQTNIEMSGVVQG